MTLNPFVMGSPESLSCFEEASPCTLEQQSMNVIANNPQSVYVPWLACMDSNDDDLSKCDSQVGIDTPATTAPADLISQYLEKDKKMHGVPTVFVDGSKVETTYAAIKAAICKSDSTISACASKAMPEGADEPKQLCTRPHQVAV
jgi:hypothetical protein